MSTKFKKFVKVTMCDVVFQFLMWFFFILFKEVLNFNFKNLIIACCILFFVFTLMLMAQDVKVIAPSTVPLDRYFELKFLVENADVESISLPKLTDFERLSGPNVSRSQSFQIVNGKQSHSSSVTYTYILQPKALGKFTIAGADLIIKGKSIKARDVEIVVTKSEGSANSSGNNARQQQSARIPLRNVTEKDLFVKVNATRVNVFEGSGAPEVGYELARDFVNKIVKEAFHKLLWQKLRILRI